MRKQELIHLHALCVLVREHAEARDDVPPGAFASYEDLGVPPSAIYRSKAAHRRAVRALTASLASSVEESDASAPTHPVADGGPGRDVAERH